MNKNIVQNIQEETILNHVGWNADMSDYFGTLVYNIENENIKIADVVVRRQEKEITVDWIVFINDKDTVKINLYFNKELNQIDFKKSSEEIKDQTDAQIFLNNIKNATEKLKSTFMPAKKAKSLSI